MATRMAQGAGFAQLGGSLFWYLVSSGTMSTDKALAAMTACIGMGGINFACYMGISAGTAKLMG